MAMAAEVSRIAELRAEQCRAWNASRAHQVLAGKARAAGMTYEERAKGGYASSAKQGAIWRAQQGLAPRRVADAQLLTPEDIRTLSARPLSLELRQRILRAWRVGVLLNVGYWLLYPAWADELEQHLDAEERGFSQPALLPMPPISGDDSADMYGGMGEEVQRYAVNAAPSTLATMRSLPPLRGMAVGWVRQLDRAEAAIAAATPHDEYAQRNASKLIDSLFAYEHQMPDTQRRKAREYVWLRDKTEPLPSEEERVEWELCRCRRCKASRVFAAREARLAGLAPDARRQLLGVEAPQRCRALDGLEEVQPTSGGGVQPLPAA